MKVYKWNTSFILFFAGASLFLAYGLLIPNTVFKPIHDDRELFSALIVTTCFISFTYLLIRYKVELSEDRLFYRSFRTFEIQRLQIKFCTMYPKELVLVLDSNFKPSKLSISRLNPGANEIFAWYHHQLENPNLQKWLKENTPEDKSMDDLPD